MMISAVATCLMMVALVYAPNDLLSVSLLLFGTGFLLNIGYSSFSVYSMGLTTRTSYPVLPWIGVIALGYCLGPWFARCAPAALRQRYLLLAGSGALLGFVALRLYNGYGEAPWASHAEAKHNRDSVGVFIDTRH